MIYLIASIISSTSIFVIFRLAKNYSGQLISLITLNYLAASVLGFIFFVPQNIQFKDQVSWLPYSALVGVLFIVMFFLIGNASQKAGITVTSLANKLSLVFPVLFSILYFQEKMTWPKLIGFITAFVAIFLTVYKKEIKKTNLLFVILPLLIFLGSGITDSIVKFVQAIKATPNQAGLFSTFVFLVAFVLALATSVVKNKIRVANWHAPTLYLGIFLGIVNFGSLYFIINALNFSKINSSLVFALNNMSIVALSAILGFLLFHEKLSKLNVAGLLLAIVSLYFLI
jgi:drug/metabolite transporter (DMT)-like permease